MFKRLVYEDWTSVVPMVAFFLTLAVFLYFLIRTVRLKRPHVEHMAKLPLDDDSNTPSS